MDVGTPEIDRGKGVEAVWNEYGNLLRGLTSRSGCAQWGMYGSRGLIIFEYKKLSGDIEDVAVNLITVTNPECYSFCVLHECSKRLLHYSYNSSSERDNCTVMQLL